MIEALLATIAVTILVLGLIMIWVYRPSRCIVKEYPGGKATPMKTEEYCSVFKESWGDAELDNSEDIRPIEKLQKSKKEPERVPGITIRNGRYRVRKTIDGVCYSIGTFDTLEKAKKQLAIFEWNNLQKL